MPPAFRSQESGVRSQEVEDDQKGQTGPRSGRGDVHEEFIILQYPPNESIPSRIFNSSNCSWNWSLDEWTCSASVMNFI